MWNKEVDIDFINDTTSLIRQYVDSRKSMVKFHSKQFNKICEQIYQVFKIWTGQTWVGEKKPEQVSQSFQNFFLALNDLICFIKINEGSASKKERRFAQLLSYHGVVYRYLGSSNVHNKKVVTPEFNDIYVSWSKEKDNSYLKSKLYGPITCLSAEIFTPDFGIDLEGFEEFYIKIDPKNCGVTRGNEREVVFPTRQDLITDIQYIYDESDENENT